MRNIFKYSKYYSGEEPEFIEGDVFRLIVPLNEDYSYDNVKNGDKKMAIKNGDKKISKKTIQNYKKIFEFMEEGKEYTIQDFCNLLNLKSSRTKELLKEQVYSSVLWEQSIRAMIADGVDIFVEIGPGKTLSGFMRKIDKSVKMFRIGTMEEVEKTVEAIKEL